MRFLILLVNLAVVFVHKKQIASLGATLQNAKIASKKLKLKLKLSHYMPRRRLGGEDI
jgi:hypothetical protein